MNSCARCGRYHSGLCCIPPLSTRRPPGRGVAKVDRQYRQSPRIVPKGPRGTPHSRSLVTEAALEEARNKLALAIKDLNALPPGTPAYEEAFANPERWLDRLSVLQLDL